MLTNGKKQSEIITLIEGINKKTGVYVSVYHNDGTPVCNTTENINVSVLGEEIFVDDENERVIFKMKLFNNVYYGMLSGCDNSAISQALLVKELCESNSQKTVDYSLEEFYRELLVGNINYSEARRYQDKFSLSQKACECLILSINEKKEDAKSIIESYIDETDKVISLNDNMLVIIRFESDSDEYRSAHEFADFLLQSIYEELGLYVKIYIGVKVKKVFDLASSYNQALVALRTSTALQSKGNVHNFKEYTLFKMLEDIPKNKLNEYLDVLLDYSGSTIFDDNEMTETAEEFLDNNLNVSETSRKLYLHRNTLTYRLDKIEKETGLDVRKFSDAVTFRLITLLKKLLK